MTTCAEGDADDAQGKESAPKWPGHHTGLLVLHLIGAGLP